MNNPKSSYAKTFRDSVIERFELGREVRVVLTNGVKLKGLLHQVNADHLIMEDITPDTSQIVRFESIATVGPNQ